MKRLPKFESGSKFGKLLIVDIQRSYYSYVAICRCNCGQMVIVSESQFKNQSKLSCQNCEASKQKFKTDEIAICIGEMALIPTNEQVIVVEQITSGLISTVKVEWRGKNYLVRPGNLKSLGINFYGKSRN